MLYFPQEKYKTHLLLDSAVCSGSPMWTLGPRISLLTTCQDPFCDIGTSLAEHSSHPNQGNLIHPVLAMIPTPCQSSSASEQDTSKGTTLHSAGFS